MGAPHFGGVWGCRVRSCKKPMLKEFSTQSLEENKMTTINCKVKQLLCSGLLNQSTGDEDNSEALALNYSFLGNCTIDNANFVFKPSSIAIKWTFWSHDNFLKKSSEKWTKENLTLLIVRQKWSMQNKRLAIVGDMFWICDQQFHLFNYAWQEFWRFTLVMMLDRQASVKVFRRKIN